MNSTVTPLDRLLYAWLAEADNRKFDRAFERYHDEAFTGLVRYLARRAGSLELDLEQIAVDALLKFFCKVGRERRQASEEIMNALTHIQPLDLGPLHVRQVRRWTADVGSYRETTMSFVVEQAQADDTQSWKTQIQSLAEQIPNLQRQSYHVLEPVRAAITSTPNQTDQVDDAPIRGFAVRLKSIANEAGAEAVAVEQKLPGAIQFVDRSWTVVEVLPLLRIPTNGYLFDIAQSLYLDECKSRGRQKRGGSGVVDHANDAGHPLARITVDDENAEQGSDGAQSLTNSATIFAIELAESPINIESERIGEEYCERFYAYLRWPLDVAEEAYRIASASGPAKVERKRLDTFRMKTERVTTVLTMRIEGQTQEAIAEALGISRNQVKYIVELMQESYAQFITACARTRAISHVQ
jgi:DNA-directed RNA polymerase specialized sigma24 family protein